MERVQKVGLVGSGCPFVNRQLKSRTLSMVDTVIIQCSIPYVHTCTHTHTHTHTHTETGSQLTASESQVSQSEEVDDDSLFSVRAKLFYKKGDGFTELGVGQLRVQQAGSGSSGVRLLLRNDTKLGTILLNVRVTTDIPVTVKGNNVFVVCVPNPPLSKEDPSSPVTYLLRVKTAQTASDLLKTLKEH